MPQSQTTSVVSSDKEIHGDNKSIAWQLVPIEPAMAQLTFNPIKLVYDKGRLNGELS